ncbi:MAG TPA: XRE family transcriptional regulator [Spirochaetes bacterium]|nr:XRE family transcriptional regulator [Spirochaetota bacterium]
MKKSESANGAGPAAKLARYRKQKSISLEELSEMTGLTAEHIKNIEEGNDFAPVGDILRLSRALAVDPDILLSAEKTDERTMKKKRDEGFTRRAKEYNYTVLTPEARHTHLRAFLIEIPPRSDHPKVNYSHEGEEFVYVLSGEVEITVGQKVHELKKGGSLHFDSSIRHTLRNPGAKKTVLIVTLYTP